MSAGGASIARAGRLIPAEYDLGTGQLRLRPVADSDLPMLARIYASTRESEMAQVPWSDEQKTAFLQFQFDAQHQYYLQHFPAASRELIEMDGVVAGRLYLDRRESELRLIDIALLPEHRGHGIGSRLLSAILAAAEAATLAVSIHVEQNNPALRLYQRLGFVPVEQQGIYLLMRWNPSKRQGAS